jgi:MYXO-CTERM domain-containing protein
MRRGFALRRVGTNTYVDHMGIARLFAFISVVAGACCLAAVHAGVAFACGPSYWYSEAEPALSCLSTKSVTGGLEVRNGCEEPIEISPEGCNEPCSETLRVGVRSSKRLELSDATDNPSEDVEHVFTYKRADQLGTITFGYSFNPCDDETGDCSTAATAGRRAPPGGVWLALVAVAALVALRRRVRPAR